MNCATQQTISSQLDPEPVSEGSPGTGTGCGLRGRRTLNSRSRTAIGGPGPCRVDSRALARQLEPGHETNVTDRNANAVGRAGEQLRAGGLRQQKLELLVQFTDDADEHDTVDDEHDDLAQAEVQTLLLSALTGLLRSGQRGGVGQDPPGRGAVQDPPPGVEAWTAA